MQVRNPKSLNQSRSDCHNTATVLVKCVSSYDLLAPNAKCKYLTASSHSINANEFDAIHPLVYIDLHK
jgi:hypothetical protein